MRKRARRRTRAQIEQQWMERVDQEESGLRRARLIRRLSRVALARLAGVHERTIHHAETGKHAPQMHTQRKLLIGLGIPFQNRRYVFRNALARRGRA